MTQTTRTHLALRGFALGALTAAAVAVAAAPALAAPGDLDPAFGTGGISVFGSQTVGLDVAKVMLVQPDGKLVIAGSDGTNDFLVHRLHADGSPDRGFAGDGTVTADFANRDDTITGIALQGDGKLVAAGRSAIGLDERAAVARFTTGGALDPAFGGGGDDGDGRITLGAGAATDLQAVAVLPGGGIAVAGATPSLNKDFAVTRLRTDGSVDDVAYEPVPSADGNDTLMAAARTPGGKLVVAGSLYRAATPGQPVTGVTRYGADGKLDKTFGTQGLATLPGMSQPHTIVPTDDNGLVLAGTSLAGDTSTVVARLDQDGRPDEGLGSGGIVDVGFPGLDMPAGLGVLGDGRILVGGTLGTELAFGAARLTADGRPDARFGNDGIAVLPVGERAVSTAGALAPGGAFVLAGPAVLPGPLKKLAVTRLQGDPPPVPPVDDPPAGGPGTGDPQPQPVADEQPPAVTGLRVSRRVAGARPRIGFTLSEAAHVTVTLKRRHGRSTRVERDAVAGANRLRGARRLVRGRHRLTVVAVDPAGNAAPPARVRFKVTAR